MASEKNQLLNYQRSEGYIPGYKESELFFQTWEPAHPALTVIITHGHGEHSECYHRLINHFQSLPVHFVSWDLRGHGKSEGKRGYVENFNDYIYDFEIFLKELRPMIPEKRPIVFLAHSLGALIQTKFLLSRSEVLTQYPLLKAQVMSGPLFGFALPVPKIKDLAAKWMNSLLPRITLWNEITNDMLTRDTAVINEFEKDNLRHGLISSGLYLGMIESTKMALDQAGNIKLPTLIQLAEKDPVISPEAARLFYQNLGSSKKRLLVYGDGARHEMYNDVHRESVFKDLQKYLEGIIAP
jgi:alpha-beta hydrolase superfamily lysophospholipase